MAREGAETNLSLQDGDWGKKSGLDTSQTH